MNNKKNILAIVFLIIFTLFLLHYCIYLMFTLFSLNGIFYYFISIVISLLIISIYFILKKIIPNKIALINEYLIKYFSFIAIIEINLGIVCILFSENINFQCDTVDKFISLSWTIIGISIAIYLFNYLLIEKIMESKFDKKEVTINSTIEKLKNKKILKLTIIKSMYPVYQLLINVNIMFFITLIYVFLGDSNLFIQKFSSFGLINSIITILSFSIEIIVTHIEKTNEKIRENTLNERDIEFENNVKTLKKLTSSKIKEIMENKSLSNEEKSNLVKKEKENLEKLFSFNLESILIFYDENDEIRNLKTNDSANKKSKLGG